MDKSLLALKKNNPNVEIEEETEHYNLKNLWKDDSFMVRLEKTSKFQALEKVELPPELSALYHKKEKKLEVIFGAAPEKYELLSRKASFFFKGIEFKTEFAQPSSALLLVANGFKSTEKEREGKTLRNQLISFLHDFLDKKNHTPSLKRHFQGMKVFSYVVSGDFEKIEHDLIALCKHINFYIRFFDRHAPLIDITFPEKSEFYNHPCKTEKGDFPKQVVASSIDPIVLDLLRVADGTQNSRLAYQFFYQVLEYFAYYHLDKDLQQTLSHTLKSPDILSNSGHYSRVIIDQLKDFANTNSNDKDKLNKLLREYIKIEDIRHELESNIEYFTKDVEFEGSFVLPRLLTSEDLDLESEDIDDSKEKKKTKGSELELINTLTDRLDKLRNVLVHLREKRENKVILPSRKNHAKLWPYVHLIQRMAETIAIKYGI